MERHKRYLVFLYDRYYPHGAIHDVKGSFESLNEALNFVDSEKNVFDYDYHYIYDRVEGLTIDTNDSNE